MAKKRHTTLTSFHRERYGAWAGNQKGREPDPARCCENVYSNGSMISHQCSRLRGFGPEEAYCHQHSPEAKAAQLQRSRERDVKRMVEWRIKMNGEWMLEVLKQIANGHSAPQALAREVVAIVEPKEDLQ